MMSEKEWVENPDLGENPADNIAADQTNEQEYRENPDYEPESTDKVSEELAEMKDSYLRLMAEYDNYRKRTVKEKAELIKNGGERTLIALLPVLDDFERALKNMESATDIPAISEGILLIYNKFITYLQQNGVKPIEAQGQDFDDELFDAVATIPAADDEQKDKVVDCVQTGYMLNDKVIRHAKVVVAK